MEYKIIRFHYKHGPLVKITVYEKFNNKWIKWLIDVVEYYHMDNMMINIHNKIQYKDLVAPSIISIRDVKYGNN